MKSKAKGSQRTKRYMRDSKTETNRKESIHRVEGRRAGIVDGGHVQLQFPAPAYCQMRFISDLKLA